MEILLVACTTLRRFIKSSLLLAALISFQNRTFAQEKVFRSDVDDLLTVEKVSVLPFTDNLQGIYARPLETHFISLVQKMHRWDYVQANSSGPILSPEELEASPEKAMQVSQGSGADAFFACRIVKGPGGIMIHLSLFLSKDGKLLSQAILKDYKKFDLNDLKEQTERLLSEIVSRLPYAGRVMSREGNRVTVNLGLKDGVQNGQMLSIIQIVQAHRHPKFNFLVRTEKEIFGKVKILKVDETLSFGTVVMEREKGAVQKNSKVGSLDFVTYNAPDSLSLNPTAEEALAQREDAGIAFGKNAHAWSPANAPSFGQLGARLGLSRFSGATELQGVGGLEGTNNFAPSIVLDGELWITQEWTFSAQLKQGIISVRNPRGGGQPSELSQALSYYEAAMGYSIRLGPYIWSPSITPFLGYFSYRLYVDESNPAAFTTQEYTGAKFGVRGQAPIGADGQWGAGGVFSTAWNPALRESPDSSGSSNKATVVQFGLFAFKKYSERLRLQANLDFEMFSANFSGTGTRAIPASSASQRYTTLTGGIYYLF
ncbi:MAG: hypothetical protein KF799_03030 [Bdellovibrionales bacterium]|nr:hypothetical protein [Bdellovibrionales bacterium]